MDALWKELAGTWAYDFFEKFPLLKRKENQSCLQIQPNSDVSLAMTISD
jgi:hypothetical protein